MPLNLQKFIAASRGHSDSEFYLKPSRDASDGPQIERRGRAGRLFVSQTRLREDRAVTAKAFRDAIAEVVESEMVLMMGSSDKVRTFHQRNLRMVFRDVEASLDQHMRGERGLTAMDIQALANKLNKKIQEVTDRSVDLYAAEVKKSKPKTLAEVQSRQIAVWQSLCPTTAMTDNTTELRENLKGYFKTRVDFRQAHLDIIDEHFDRIDSMTLTDPIEKAVWLADHLEALHHHLLGYSIDLARPRSKVSFTPGAELGSGGFGTVRELMIDDREALFKSFVAGGGIPITLDASTSLDPKKPKLNRGLEVTAGYLDEEEKIFIVAPTHYLIQEIVPGRVPETLRFVVESKGREFKSWARDQLIKNSHVPGYQLKVVGQIQDKADGVDLSKAMRNFQIPHDMLKPIAKGYMSALIAMAKRGFVHGDIKPSNTFYDPSVYRLKLIDTGGMAKISKRVDRITQTSFNRGRGITGGYSLPSVVAGRSSGPEADLFSVGVSMLELSLGADDLSMANGLTAFISSRNQDVRTNVLTEDEASNQIENYINTIIQPAVLAVDNVPAQAAIQLINDALHYSRTGGIADNDQYLERLRRLKNLF